MSFLRLGLLGHPLEHSLSPVLHRAALKAAGLAGEYRLFDIPPEQAQTRLPEYLTALQQGRLHGLNVTLPYKQRVMAWVHTLSEPARMCAAVNTLGVNQGQVVGHNTDVQGFWEDLRARLPRVMQWEQPRAVLLGAGGAARAVAYALLRQGWTVYVLARRFEQARALSYHFRQRGFSRITPFPWEARIAPQAPWFQEAGPVLLVNATPVGMYPHVQASPWPEPGPWPREAAVYDLVYNPRDTVFVQAARRAGLPAVDGLGMLVHQAALAFAYWTGVPPAQVLPAMAAAVGWRPDEVQG